MLLKFSCQNIFCFRDEVVLDLLAGTDDSHPDHLMEVGDKGVRVLGNAVILGANAAGKSNLVRALQLLLHVIREGSRPHQNLPYFPFRLDLESPGRPTVFEMIFFMDGRTFRYGLAYNAREVLEESLSEYINGREKSLFSRLTVGEKVTVDISRRLASGKRGSFLAFVAEGTRPNQPFLTECAEKNVYELESVHRWVGHHVLILTPTEPYNVLPLYEDVDASLKSMAGFLKKFDTGIEDITSELVPVDEDALQQAPSDIREQLNQPGSRVLLQVDGELHVYLRDEKGSLCRLDLGTIHGKEGEGNPVRFRVAEESEGTRRLMQLLPALSPGNPNESVLVVDEMDRSLHPLLLQTLIRDFGRRSLQTGRRQLILTTHETSILDLDLLRRDEIWFVEKGPDGSSTLRSLADYKIRKDLRVERGYLSGRFGAIPVIASSHDHHEGESA